MNIFNNQALTYTTAAAECVCGCCITNFLGGVGCLCGRGILR